MFGNNPILPPRKGKGSDLEIKEIFATFQGEGLYTGYPAIFVRLSGCNLACKFCDTDFDSGELLDIDEIITRIKSLAAHQDKITHNLVVITGGEPFRQNISPLCRHLLDLGFMVQIETNGTLYQDLPVGVHIICSPKNSGNGYGKIRSDLLSRINAFKFLISAHNSDYKFIPDCGQEHYQIPVYLQPMDEYDEEKNRHNRDLALKLATENGCRLSLQTHKIWMIR